MKKFRSDKEKDIVETAYNLFRKVSFIRVGIDRIIEESNVAKNTFYVYFNSKEKLLFECLEYEILITQNSIQALILDHKKNGSKACLEAIYQWHVAQVCEPNYTGNLIIKASVELVHLPEVKLILTEYSAWLFVNISTLLEDLGITDIGVHQVLINLLAGVSLPTSVYLPTWEDIENLIRINKNE